MLDIQYGGGGVHHSRLLWGLGSSLALTCIKSECSGYARGGGGGGGSGVSNDDCVIYKQ